MNFALNFENPLELAQDAQGFLFHPRVGENSIADIVEITKFSAHTQITSCSITIYALGQIIFTDI